MILDVCGASGANRIDGARQLGYEIGSFLCKLALGKSKPVLQNCVSVDNRGNVPFLGFRGQDTPVGKAAPVL